MANILEIHGISVSFGGLAALADFSMEVEEGSIQALIGPNGAGKSTLFNCISRFIPPDRGAIRFKGKDLLRLAAHRLIEEGISRTFQNIVMFPGLTVEENLLVGQHHLLKAGSIAGGLRTRRVRGEEETARENAAKILRQLHLEAYRSHPARDLPVGLQRLVELGRSLLARPQLLLLDEPASGMNPREKESLSAKLTQLRRDCRLTILLVEHDMDFVMGIAEKITVLDFGQKIAEGTPGEIQKHERVLEAYLGRGYAPA